VSLGEVDQREAFVRKVKRRALETDRPSDADLHEGPRPVAWDACRLGVDWATSGRLEPGLSSSSCCVGVPVVALFAFVNVLIHLLICIVRAPVDWLVRCQRREYRPRLERAHRQDHGI
jgi:hypothetical protein